MRAVLTYMLTGQVCENLDKKSYLALRMVADINPVAGDMTFWAAKRFREACVKISQITPKENEDGQAKEDKNSASRAPAAVMMLQTRN